MKRSEFIASTGTDISNPREHPNRITSFIDGSAVYGSEVHTADWLRDYNQGKLKVSKDNLLPFNTLNGELTNNLDQDAPHMADAVGASSRLFVAGDIRANENVLLTAFHTLFVREHNRLCDELILENPTWSDEELYQYARKMVGGFLQSISYQEWLPAMGVHVPHYEGYDEEVNPAIMNIFSGAAFRMHSLINPEILRMDNDGNTISFGNLSLKDAFFNPAQIYNRGGIDPLFKGMATVVAQEFDSKIIDELRNFLFGAPGAGGLDLAAININRGRERGFPDYNTVRENFGLTRLTDFSEICSNDDIVATLQDLYNNDINNIDPFVGFVCEDHMNDALVGETMMHILTEQFKVLRDGDRYYFEIDPMLSPEHKAEIKNTRLVDIILRNTDITLMQGNLFAAMDHDVLSDCNALSPNVTIFGSVQTIEGELLSDVDISFTTSNGAMLNNVQSMDGNFTLNNIPSCYDYTITPMKDVDPANGVSTYDLVLIQKHVLGIEYLTSPYYYIAADATNDDKITTSDIVEIRKLILGIIPDFTNNDSWKFVESSYTFENPLDPLEENYPESYATTSINDNQSASFTAVKIGDVNGNAVINLDSDADSRNNLTDLLTFNIKDRSVVEGQEYSIEFKSKDLIDIISYQFTLNYDPTMLELVDIKTGYLKGLSEGNFGVFPTEGMITTSWNLPGGITDDEMRAQDAVFTLVFKGKATGQLRDLLSITSRKTSKEAVTDQLEAVDIALEFEGVDGEAIIVAENFEVYQNQPNPFKENTTFGFYLPKAGEVTVKLTDVSGKLVSVIKEDYAQGYNKVNLQRKDIKASGVLYYEVISDYGTATKKMLLIE